MILDYTNNTTQEQIVIDNEINDTITDDNFSAEEPAVEELENVYIKASELIREEAGLGGGNYMFDRGFDDESYNFAYLSTLNLADISLVVDEILNQWIEDVYLKKTSEERAALPAIYQAIHELTFQKMN